MRRARTTAILSILALFALSAGAVFAAGSDVVANSAGTKAAHIMGIVDGTEAGRHATRTAVQDPAKEKTTPAHMARGASCTPYVTKVFDVLFANSTYYAFGNDGWILSSSSDGTMNIFNAASDTGKYLGFYYCSDGTFIYPQVINANNY
jgi:hypothetical protein